MNQLIIQETEDTPKINFNVDKNIFEISGRSYPDNVFLFYEPVFAWLNNYANNPKKITNFIFKLDYFNTASAKILFDILMILDNIHTQGNTVEIKWFYKKEDEDMKEAGESYIKLVKSPIDVICID